MVMGQSIIFFHELVLFIVAFTILATPVAGMGAQAKPGCQSHCGNLSIPYPFGTGNGCNISHNFFITCNSTAFNPPKAFLTNSTIEVLNISLDGHLHINSLIGSDCYNRSGRSSYGDAWLRLSKFLISSRNKFIAIGCDTLAFVQGSLGHKYSTGCLTLCNNITDLMNGSCSGIGCCQTAIPRGVRNYYLGFASYNNHSDILSFNPCSYGVVVEDGAYNFSTADFSDDNFLSKKFPMILDWTIGNQTCTEAKMDPENYACKENSRCIDPENGPGYLCKCLDGFEGNPYLSHGCQDIDECHTQPCDGTCHNLAGSYNCSCLEGFKGDGWKNGTGCSPIIPHRQSFPIVVVALVIGISVLASLLCSSWVYLGLRQRKLTKLKQKNFQQNGGFLLREEISKRKGCGETATVLFTAEELKKATDNYHESRILGRGGQGTVYKGILLDGQTVAIKMSVIGDQSQVQQFINEVIVLSHINHRNVVKLLGCCLETRVPLLVYEYVRNGTLFDHLHNVAGASRLSWETRLKISTETAEALSYLHSAASPPIIHRDVKLTNVLLDENYNARVSDFGSSRLIPSDEAQITTLVQGTLGYLDPEYFHSSQLTEKSDVYSFGIVLIELLTGLKALSFQRPEQERNLAMHFVSMMKEDHLLEILDRRVMNEETVEQLKEVATLARRCVRVKGEERPTMKEVACELEGLRTMKKHPWGKADMHEEEVEGLLHDDLYNINSTGYDGSTSISIGSASIKNPVRFEIDGAR
ncbi:hypothetical protein DITRI_Ditri14bG0112000 [Diplodiscus trichospermus]